MAAGGAVVESLARPHANDSIEVTRLRMKHAARNGSQFLEKSPEMVWSCWGFEKNVSRETFFSSGERITKIVESLLVAAQAWRDRHVPQRQQEVFAALPERISAAI
ncbi:MAG TPA: hypothetical protein VIO10_08595 [Candidatus Binatus sp.]